MSNQIFQTLKELPTTLSQVQCVLHKHELLICGGNYERAFGHCVVKLIDNNKDKNQITLLSFGGYYKHTLVMKYVSVWTNDNNNYENKMNKSKKLNKSNNCNEWTPFKDNHNHPIIIGRDNDNYRGMRALVGGINNHLLFITYFKNNISVFDLNIFQFIKHDTLPTIYSIWYHCFVSKPENKQEQEMMKTNKQNYQMLLFKQKTVLSIEYDEDNNTFQFHKLPVCKDITPFCAYACVCINDVVLSFGGYSGINDISKSVFKYSIRENKWMTFENTLPSPLSYCVAILREEDNHIHIIGGKDDKNASVSTHMKTKVREWDPSQLSKNEIKCIVEHWIQTLKIKLGWINDFKHSKTNDSINFFFSVFFNKIVKMKDFKIAHSLLLGRSH
ncbi:hypothetical protein RFI_00937 [Reticulomyxa filosa]|uniref:Kelch motif family protein n=1 Tax=Reticulomyxa filosa TaxID=46433 RepID=X6PDJ1_RETFI|nr:hypothetical protein RFI_00937 [Reticulomyxa filosa]|eukprot:ETO36124.1 hypothetical protein RFI_00937 [Reticulomyxa filosa]